MIRIQISKEEYNKYASEHKLRMVEDQNVKVVNYNYVPNYLMLDIHQKSLMLCAGSSKVVFKDKLALENLVKYHQACLDDLKVILEKPNV